MKKVVTDKGYKNTSVKFIIEKQEFQRIIKAHAAYRAISESVLAGINVRVADNRVVFVTTDGARLLKTQIDTQYENKNKEFGPVTYNLKVLEKIKFVKNMNSAYHHADSLEIELNKNFCKICDVANDFVYKIPSLKGKYPECEKLIPNYGKKAHKIVLNQNYLGDVKYISTCTRTKMISLTVNKNCNLSPVFFEGENELGTKTMAMIMSIRVRN